MMNLQVIYESIEKLNEIRTKLLNLEWEYESEKYKADEAIKTLTSAIYELEEFTW